MGQGTSSSPETTATNPQDAIVVGCVCYSSAIPAIWEGMKAYFASRGVPFDCVFFTTYDRQVEALLAGTIDIAWSGPLAHVRIQKRTQGASLSLGMRDVDVGFASSVVFASTILKPGAEQSSQLSLKTALEGRRVAMAAHDSPQGCILPLEAVRAAGVDLKTIDAVRFDRDVGKHGDTAAGEVEVIKALAEGRVEAGFVSDMMWARAVNAGDVDGDKFTSIPLPPFNHCQFDALPSLSKAKRDAFVDGVFAMSTKNPDEATLMQQEGIREKWARPDEPGYDAMRRALRDEPAVPFPPPHFSIESHPFKSLVVDEGHPSFAPRPLVRSCAAVPSA